VGAAGADGTVAGVTLLLAGDAAPCPTALVALTVKVYAVPFVKPVTVSGEEAPLALKLPGELVTWYEVMVEPLLAGAVNVTVACAFPPTAVGAVGADGTLGVVTLLVATLAAPVPAALVAVTVKV
jgi:hypothetical protein